MEVASYLSTWTIDPLDGVGKIFTLQLDHPGFVSIVDDTRTPDANTPNDPNQVVVIATGTTAWHDGIEPDANYVMMTGTRMAV